MDQGIAHDPLCLEIYEIHNHYLGWCLEVPSNLRSEM
jgi:hypothetical protein